MTAAINRLLLRAWCAAPSLWLCKKKVVSQ